MTLHYNGLDLPLINRTSRKLRPAFICHPDAILTPRLPVQMDDLDKNCPTGTMTEFPPELCYRVTEILGAEFLVKKIHLAEHDGWKEEGA